MDRIFSVARKSGFDGIELIFNEDPLTTDPSAIRELMERFALPVLSAHMPMDTFTNFGSRAETIIRRCIGIGDQVGIEKLVIHPWRKGVPDYATHLPSVVAAVKDRTDIEPLVENLPRQVSDIELDARYYTPALLARMFGQSLCLDTSHLATTKLIFEDAVEKVISRVAHVHLSDSSLHQMSDAALQDDHLFVGEGKLPLQWLINQLMTDDYKGDYCMELRPAAFGKKEDDEIVAKLCQVVDRARHMVERAVVTGI